MANSRRTPQHKAMPREANVDPRMIVSCFQSDSRAVLGRRGPDRTAEDDPARARFIEELLKRRIH